MKGIVLSICLLWCFSVWGQTPADWWYFGDSAGIHFTPNGPVSVNDGSLWTGEGCASISDPQGNLMFYTDGIKVWDASHNLMPNGTDLLGNPSSTQSAVIVPRPLSIEQYYIFTMHVFDTIGANYTLVDMTLNGGLGDVVAGSKNMPIRKGVREKLTLLEHANGTDFWVLYFPMVSDSVIAYQLTSSGLNPTPQITTTNFESQNTTGYTKANINGDLIVNANETGQILLYSFDASTGIVTNTIFWQQDYFTTGLGSVWGGYGAEFSPNSQVLYTAPRFGPPFGHIRQYDLSTLDSASIHSSEFILADSIGAGALQLGPDKKIYIAESANPSVGQIADPNVLGVGANYTQGFLDLSPNISWNGLPPFVASLAVTNVAHFQRCFGDTTFFLASVYGVDSIHWNFGDPASGAMNTDTGFATQHLFSDTGTFTVTLYSYSDTTPTIDTLTKTVRIRPRQRLSFNDTALCGAQPFVLDIGQDYSSYLWSDSSIADSFVIDQDTTIWATVFGVCDTVSDTITVVYHEPLKLNIGPDTLLCQGEQFVIDAELPPEVEFTWSNGQSLFDTLVVNASGEYSITASNACGTMIDSITVEFFDVQLLQNNLLPADTIICDADSIVIERPRDPSINYNWSDGTSSARITVSTSSKIWLQAAHFCGEAYDTMNIVIGPKLMTSLGEDTTICELDSVLIFGTDSLASYAWSTGDTTDTIWTNVGTSETYTVTITLGPCEFIQSRKITSSELACGSINCSLEYGNYFTPNGDGVNDRFRVTSNCDIIRFDMAIYNRWGQLVNYTRNVAYGWDGYINGEPASEGTYYFVVTFRDRVVVDSDRKLTQGSFDLVR